MAIWGEPGHPATVSKPQESTLDKLLAQMQQAQATTQAATAKREAEIRAITDEIIQRYQPGGAFEKAGMAQIGLARTQAVGGGLQRLISSGLAGTEAAGGLETGFEQGAGARMRMSLEDIMMQRLSTAQMGKAAFVERIQDVGPDPGMIAQLAMQAGQAPTGAVGGESRYDKGPSPWEPGFMGGGWTLSGGGGGGGGGPAQVTPATGARGTGPTPGGGVNIPMGEPIIGAPGGKVGLPGGGVAEYAEKYQAKAPTPGSGDIPMSGGGFYQVRGGLVVGQYDSGGKYTRWKMPMAASKIRKPRGYAEYKTTMQKTQPGAVTATPAEYKTIQQRLKAKYPQTYG